MRTLIALLIAVVLTSMAFTAFATPEEAEAALKAWADAYAARDGEKSVALYAEDARLWGTEAAKQSVGRDAIRAYFDAGKALKARVVEFGDHACRMADNAAICSGNYTFERTPNEGEAKKAPARFSMVLAKRNGRWLILDHHSSLLPAAH
jgi:uncharacterized protein (TIGR02246 family)